MTHEDIAAPLATALAERGYETLTAVQQAVLSADARGRDLLVSAQTGSGKTVAFGIAAAPDLLGGDDVLPNNSRPLLLAIAPTRELALQVATELKWLYATARGRIATCVGGMDYRAERRSLNQGAQIVVGTPGRLRDHIERGSLDLSDLRVAVLDEADEMLDLGFREDLEFILKAAPAQRRTLMFSATVPAAIEKLARDFQHDSLRIAAMGEARQHGDIAYRALSVVPRDRENAIFNMLRYHEARTAIIFCKTRANVSHLVARMGNRGFRVVALSGELSQQERNQALQALRDGRARVCIATDVAARGIDLPGLELVIHADLPNNAETLLHRSGRTGRAGAKGVSALIVTSAETSKAQRLLRDARVDAEWGQAPSAEEISTRDDARMLEHPALGSPLDDMTIARDLLERVGAEQIAAAFIQLWREGRPPPEELSEVVVHSDTPRRPVRDFGASVWFTLSVGQKGRAEARWILPRICEAGGITRDAIGAIRVHEQETWVQIAATEAPRFGETVEIEPGLVIRRTDREPPPNRKPERRPAHKPAKPYRDRDRERAPRVRDAEAAARPAQRDHAPARPQRPQAGPGVAGQGVSEGQAEPAAFDKPNRSKAKKAARGKKGAAASTPHAAKPAGNRARNRTGSKPAKAGHAAPQRPRDGSAPLRRAR